MLQIQTEFDRRVEEINLYFNFVSNLQDQPILRSKEVSNRLEFEIDRDLVRILKANGFLLLYNLVEFACRGSILTIYETINNEELPFQEASQEIQQLWLSHRTKGINIHNENVAQAIHKITEVIVRQEKIEFEQERLRNDIKTQLSGNVDASKIRDGLAKDYGFSAKVSQPKQGAALKTVRDNRNDLAHGHITFAERGADYSELEMVKIKDDVVNYLHDILTNIETFLNQKHYKKTVT